MNKTLHISTQAHSWGRVAKGKDKCMVRIIYGNTTHRILFGINYGKAIAGLMQDYGCTKLTYSPLARLQFLGKKA